MKRIFIGVLNSIFPSFVRKKVNAYILYVPKRLRIIIMTFCMMLVLTIATFFPFNETWYVFICILALSVYITSYLAIYEGIDGVEHIMLFTMPLLFTLALYVFYSLLPVRWLTRLPFLGLFSLGYYAMLLSSNIFNVGVEKSIQLYRAAFSVNFISQTLVVFISAIVILSFRLNFVITSLFFGVIIALVAVQMLWTVELPSRIDKRLMIYASISALFLTELMILLSFVPFAINIYALIVTTAYYSIIGIVSNHLGNRLFKGTIREYGFVFIFVLCISLLTISW